jgi:cytochrome c biogenesis protein CcmG/thiol:disulfide interchange protein DsbE
MNRRLKLFIPVVIFLIISGFLMFGLTRDPNIVPSALIDQPLPVFAQPSLYPEQGEFSNDDFIGSILLVNIWGSWCPPCHLEHPLFMELSESEQGITFVGISYDYSMEEDKLFLEEKGNPFDYNVVDFDSSLRIDLAVLAAFLTFFRRDRRIFF